jgi:uncharacterized protein (TIGR03067 family)
MNLIVAFALTSFTAAPVPKDALQEAKQGFQGEWKFVEVRRNGELEKPEDIAKGSFTVKGDKIQIKFLSHDDTLPFVLDPKADPPSIDITTTIQAVNEVTKVIKGIYKLEKDKLTICFGIGGTERPKTFKSSAGSNTTLIVLERVKK